LLLVIAGLYAISGPAMWVWHKLHRKRGSGQGAT
jgi:hypothetical protein